MHAAYGLVPGTFFIKSRPNLCTVLKNILNTAKWKENKKIEAEGRVFADKHTTTHWQWVIKSDYFCMCLYIVCQENPAWYIFMFNIISRVAMIFMEQRIYMYIEWKSKLNALTKHRNDEMTHPSAYLYLASSIIATAGEHCTIWVLSCSLPSSWPLCCYLYC